LKEPDAETATAATGEDEGNPAYTPDPSEELSAQIAIQHWQPEQKTLTITARSPGFAVLRLMDYPAWQVRANQAAVGARPHRNDGLMTIPIQPGATRIEIAYAATVDVWWGRGLTAASLLLLLAIAVARKPGLQE